ncbi:transcription factor [Mrakia frigida]|uniref:transcription factor n=1 Tax=Mrakia frigida TaxID=29902 RepID=UPI003FCC20A1
MSQPPPQQFKAIVKSVLSGDTLILRGKPGQERILHLAGISAPRMGSSQREEEPHSFPAREFLRILLTGKEVSFIVLHSLKGEQDREYGIATIPGLTPTSPPRDIASLVVEAGWAKVREATSTNEQAPETVRKAALKALETSASSSSLGLWGGQEVQRTVSYMSDSQALLQEWKGKPIDAIVESVRDGSTLRVRLLLSNSEHQFITLSIAGIKAPRMGGSGGSDAIGGEPWCEEAKYFVETRLLGRQVRVVLLSSPASIGVSPLSSSPTPPPSNGSTSILPPAPQQTSSVFIGLVRHPAGDIAPFLVAQGLAKVLSWHAGLLSSFAGTLDTLRSAEASAKSKRLAMWENEPVPAAPGAGASNGGGARAVATPSQEKEVVRNFEGVVTRIWGADQISVLEKGEQGSERRIQLSSVRGPRPSDPKQQYWANEAKEFLRKKLIGKPVQVTVDYIKPAEGDFDARTCVTVRRGGAHSNVAEVLIEKGFASVLRHRRDDEERSPDLDKLVVAEQTAITELRGIHSGKDMPLPRIIDASESGSKASQFLPFFKRAGKHAAVVDFVAAGSRFKILLPKEEKKLTFVLAGIRAPRTARNPSEKSEPFGNEAHRFASKFMQRDVEVDFESVDKTGGFIGAMYVDKTTNVAVELVRAGLATVHGFSAESLPYGKQLLAAEEEAKRSKRNLWHSFDPAVEEAATELAAASLRPAVALPTAYFDVVVSCVRTLPPFGFSVQILNAANSNGKALEKLMNEFTLYHKTTAAKSPTGWTPKAGDIISGQFSEDDRWYRARVKRASALKKECEVVFIDYGNEETLPFTRVRPLAPNFKTLSPQAHDARLSFIKLVKPGTEYAPDSLDRFREQCEGRKLIANIDYKDPSALHLRLIDPEDPQTARDPLHSINSSILRDGLASLDSECRYTSAYPAVRRSLEDALNLAKRERLGQYEFGDLSED